MNDIKAKIGPSGRVVIPASVRKELGIAVGDEVTLRIVTVAQAVANAQALVKRYSGKDDVPLSEDLIRERRREAADG